MKEEPREASLRAPHQASLQAGSEIYAARTQNHPQKDAKKDNKVRVEAAVIKRVASFPVGDGVGSLKRSVSAALTGEGKPHCKWSLNGQKVVEP